jgi:hypothetical protein
MLFKDFRQLFISVVNGRTQHLTDGALAGIVGRYGQAGGAQLVIFLFDPADPLKVAIK